VLPLTRARLWEPGESGKTEPSVLREPIQQRSGIMEAAGLVDQLLDVHRDRDSLREAAGSSTGLGGLRDLGGFS
jgi:hypothetical protein